MAISSAFHPKWLNRLENLSNFLAVIFSQLQRQQRFDGPLIVNQVDITIE